jgi:hypothetical protein
VCLIAGLLSPLSAQAVTAALAKNLPDNQLHWVNGGHMAPVAEPDKVNPIFSDFIQQVEMLVPSFGAASGWHAPTASCAGLGSPLRSHATIAA